MNLAMVGKLFTFHFQLKDKNSRSDSSVPQHQPLPTYPPPNTSPLLLTPHPAPPQEPTNQPESYYSYTYFGCGNHLSCFAVEKPRIFIFSWHSTEQRFNESKVCVTKSLDHINFIYRYIGIWIALKSMVQYCWNWLRLFPLLILLNVLLTTALDIFLIIILGILLQLYYSKSFIVTCHLLW